MSANKLAAALQTAGPPDESRELLAYVLVEYLVLTEDAPAKREDIALLFSCLDEALSLLE